MSSEVYEILVLILWDITICPLSKLLKSAASRITLTNKRKNYQLESSATVKYQSNLIMCISHYSDKLIAKCLGGQYVLALQCVYDTLIMC